MKPARFLLWAAVLMLGSVGLAFATVFVCMAIWAIQAAL
jgi:hypothetical protein